MWWSFVPLSFIGWLVLPGTWSTEQWPHGRSGHCGNEHCVRPTTDPPLSSWNVVIVGLYGSVIILIHSWGLRFGGNNWPVFTKSHHYPLPFGILYGFRPKSITWTAFFSVVHFKTERIYTDMLTVIRISKYQLYLPFKHFQLIYKFTNNSLYVPIFPALLSLLQNILATLRGRYFCPKKTFTIWEWNIY